MDEARWYVCPEVLVDDLTNQVTYVPYEYAVVNRMVHFYLTLMDLFPTIQVNHQRLLNCPVFITYAQL